MLAAEGSRRVVGIADGYARLTRRRLLGAVGASAGAALLGACAPGGGPSSAATAVPASAPATSAAAAATPVPTPAPATPSPTPRRTPFSIAQVKDPLIDDHTHPIVPQQGDQAKYVDGLVQLMDQNNVAVSVMHRNAQWAVPGSTFGTDHDDWVRSAMDRYPGRILGGLGGFDPSSADAPAYVRAQLQTGKWAFVGELDLRNPGPKTQIPINSPIVLEIARIAAEFKVPLVFHYNYDYPGGDPQVGFRELEDAVAKNPNTIYVNAHNPPVELMGRYPNLWGEMSLFAPQFPNKQILRQVGQIPGAVDRLCLCITDVQTPDLQVIAGLPQPITYAEAVRRARDLLADLSADQRDKIAYKNLVRLLKLS